MIVTRNFHDVAKDIRDSDLLLFRRPGLISWAGRGEHSHAAKAIWWGDELFCVEVREWVGGRAKTLRSQVERYPERIDVFRANAIGLPELNRADLCIHGQRPLEFYDRQGAARFMRGLTGCDYGYAAIVTAACLHLPGLWHLPQDIANDKAWDKARPPFCSTACVLADRIGGGYDPVPNLADRLTEPCDLARSPFYKYEFTLKF